MNKEIIKKLLIMPNIAIYLLIINILTFLLMIYDKHEAKIGEWRISEKTLFVFAMLGGSLGGIIGMYVARHKTKKWYFKYGFPLIFIMQLVVVGYLLYYVK